MPDDASNALALPLASFVFEERADRALIGRWFE
jgi:hypothetical protein